MKNKNNYQNDNREVREESYTKANGQVQTNIKRTEETVNNNSYRNGYINAQEDLVARDRNNGVSGLLIGLLFTSLVGLIGGVLFFLNQRNDTPAPVAPAIVVPQKSEAQKVPEKQTTIIEKTREIAVPVPQQQAPAPQPSVSAPQPNINISIPNSQPTPPTKQQAPSELQAPKKSENQSNTTSTQKTNSDNKASTPTQDESTKTDTQSGNNSVSADTNSTNNSAP